MSTTGGLQSKTPQQGSSSRCLSDCTPDLTSALSGPCFRVGQLANPHETLRDSCFHRHRSIRKPAFDAPLVPVALNCGGVWTRFCLCLRALTPPEPLWLGARRSSSPLKKSGTGSLPASVNAKRSAKHGRTSRPCHPRRAVYAFFNGLLASPAYCGLVTSTRPRYVVRAASNIGDVPMYRASASRDSQDTTSVAEAR